MIATIKKPRCPTFEQLEHDVEITNALHNLGVNPKILKAIDKDMLIFNKLVEIWKEYGKKNQIPTITDIVRSTNQPDTTVRSVMERLIRQGRVIRLGRGIYLPKTQKV
jgi:hypothetical protein